MTSVADGEDRLVFVNASRTARWRAQSAFTKEPGTVAWIRGFTSSDVFVDVGANIGVYTLLAASRVSHVYAVEPFADSAAVLRRNVVANKHSNVTIIQAALWSRVGSRALVASERAESGSACHAWRAHGDYLVPSLTWDRIAEDHPIHRPTRLKIDTDGTEEEVLQGMRGLLATRSVADLLVEWNPGQADGLDAFLNSFGYVFVERQFTARGADLLRRGRRPEEIAHNLLFRRH